VIRDDIIDNVIHKYITRNKITINFKLYRLISNAYNLRKSLDSFFLSFFIDLVAAALL